jgi:hypothetical protein
METPVTFPPLTDREAIVEDPDEHEPVPMPAPASLIPVTVPSRIARWPMLAFWPE